MVGQQAVGEIPDLHQEVLENFDANLIVLQRCHLIWSAQLIFHPNLITTTVACHRRHTVTSLSSARAFGAWNTTSSYHVNPCTERRSLAPGWRPERTTVRRLLQQLVVCISSPNNGVCGN
jgi:hypothetical protein